MAFCRQCGQQLAGAGQFCSACGARAVEFIPAEGAEVTHAAPSAPQIAGRPERTFLKTRGVLVTNVRVVIGNQVYAMSGVSSVAFDRSPQRWAGALLWAAAALASLTAAILEFDTGPIFLLAIFAVSTSISMLCWQQGKPRYWAMLRTMGGESRVLTSRDRRYIGTVVMAINEAMISRG